MQFAFVIAETGFTIKKYWNGGAPGVPQGWQYQLALKWRWRQDGKWWWHERCFYFGKWHEEPNMPLWYRNLMAIRQIEEQ